MVSSVVKVRVRFNTQEVGDTLIGKDGLMVMAGLKRHKTHGFHVFDVIPFTSPN